MKVSSKNYKGIEYVQLIDLPVEQREKISESLNEEILIKILIGEIVVQNCIQYKDYEFWFDNVYRKSAVKQVVRSEQFKEEAVELALGNS
jgi:hypothetical protein